MPLRFYISFVLLSLCSCKEDSRDSKQDALFLLRDDLGIEFNNALEYTESFNPYTYRNFYNGGGVSIGDINNDGLDDIYFTGNMVDNMLLLNEGDWSFRDITESSGTACPSVWSTGSNMVDINGDGLLDIYVCKGGQMTGDVRHNELFINNGDLTFTESSSAYGLDITGLSIQSAFLDYDKDGDLDCYLLNNSTKSVGGYDLRSGQRDLPSENGNKLLENQNGTYVDVSEAAGIYTSNIGFGLGITLSDFNGDSWTDIYISNDFFEKDYLYINQTDGTFVESGEDYFECFPLGAMGADAGDLNNDTYPDLMVTEMLPSQNATRKNKAIYDSWKKYSQMESKGYACQMPRNILQANRHGKGFLELGRKAGMEATDWSWSSLIFDFDNDGYKDVFVTNGIYKDLLDRDYLAFVANDSKIQSLIECQKEAVKNLIDSMPTQAVSNFGFKNMGRFNFENGSKELGLDYKGYSNGCAYGDFDNDGDLDLVVNNVNAPSHIYENKSSALNKYNYLNIELSESSKNTSAIGAKVILHACNQTFTTEQYPSRGFQSSISHSLHIGMGECATIDSLTIQWPDGTIQKVESIEPNQSLEIKKIATDLALEASENLKNLSEFDTLDWKHNEGNFNQFNREKLLFQMNVAKGPRVISHDFNKDGNDDIIYGGGKNQPIHVELKDENFNNISAQKITDKINSEITDLGVLDADGDGDDDVYVACGGTAFAPKARALDDFLLINDGQGNFEMTSSFFSFNEAISTSSVCIGDINNDGKDDVLITNQNSHLSYGTKGSVYIYQNDNNGYKKFKNESLEDVGIITDSLLEDVNGDGLLDLIIVGEWMGIRLWVNDGERLVEQSQKYGLADTRGMWNHISAYDFDHDGDLDLIAGNIGDNSPLSIHSVLVVDDFDSNGFSEQILCERIDDNLFPVIDMDELFSQLPFLKRKFMYYKDYSKASMSDLFGQSSLDKLQLLELDVLRSVILRNDGGTFSIIDLPEEVNYSTVNTSFVIDVNDDGKEEILLGGNHYKVKPQYGRMDASRGWVLYRDPNTDELNYQAKEMGIRGQLRSIVSYQNDRLLFGINNDHVLSLPLDQMSK